MNQANPALEIRDLGTQSMVDGPNPGDPQVFSPEKCIEIIRREWRTTYSVDASLDDISRMIHRQGALILDPTATQAVLAYINAQRPPVGPPQTDDDQDESWPWWFKVLIVVVVLGCALAIGPRVYRYLRDNYQANAQARTETQKPQKPPYDPIADIKANVAKDGEKTRTSIVELGDRIVAAIEGLKTPEPTETPVVVEDPARLATTPVFTITPTPTPEATPSPKKKGSTAKDDASTPASAKTAEPTPDPNAPMTYGDFQKFLQSQYRFDTTVKCPDGKTRRVDEAIKWLAAQTSALEGRVGKAEKKLDTLEKLGFVRTDIKSAGGPKPTVTPTPPPTVPPGSSDPKATPVAAGSSAGEKKAFIDVGIPGVIGIELGPRVRRP